LPNFGGIIWLRYSTKDILMRTLFVLLLLSPTASLAQSPFDGTWIVDENVWLPKKPLEYSFANGLFRCWGYTGNEAIKADGNNHKVPETSYWDTVSVRELDAYTLEIVAKKAGKTTYTEIDTVSSDGGTLTQVVKDTTESQMVTTEIVSQRLGKAPIESHALSGSWHAYKVNRSQNGLIIKYKCTADGFSARTLLGEGFDAKFDGKDYLVEDDPAHTMVSVRLLGPNAVEQTYKRSGKVVSVERLTVAPDGETIHTTFEDKEANTTISSEMRKQPR
jgi:hypothetical protein